MQLVDGRDDDENGNDDLVPIHDFTEYDFIDAVQHSECVDDDDANAEDLDPNAQMRQNYGTNRSHSV